MNATPDVAIRLRFDEPINDAQVAQLARLIRVNPDVPDFDIELDEDTIVLTPQAALVTNMTYSVTILPGIQDREGNPTVQPKTILFSVGGEEPITLSIVRATILRDTLPAAGAAYRLDNTELELGYDAVADSQGTVTLESVAYGSYVATAWLEQESPFGWQETEEPGARDSFRLSLDVRAHEATYRLAVVDTLPPVILAAEIPSSRQVAITVDDTLERAPRIEEVRFFEGPLDLAADAVLDTLPLAAVQVRRIQVVEVVATGPAGYLIRVAEALREGRVYRIELIGVENESGLAANPAGGRTFRAVVAGPEVRPSEPIPWPGAPP